MVDLGQRLRIVVLGPDVTKRPVESSGRLRHSGPQGRGQTEEGPFPALSAAWAAARRATGIRNPEQLT